MPADLAAFRVEFPPPAFAATADAAINRALLQARLLHAKRELCTLYAAAHLVVLDTELLDAQGVRKDVPDGGSGVVTAESTGPLKREFMTTAGNERDAFFSTSVYGRRFLALERRTPGVGIAAMVVG